MTIRREKIIILLVALAISFVLYSNSLNGDFVSDDKLVILQNPLVNGSFSSFFKIFSAPYYYSQPHAGLYRPLTTASYNLNKVFSSEPFGFHLVNIVLNALNGLLVFFVVARLINKKSAYLAMVLFMFLPIHSEAISANVGRAELLMFLFSVWSFLLTLDKKHALASLVFLAGLLSKETAAGFFLIFLYLWKFKEGRTLKQTFYNSLYFVPSIAIYAVMRVSILGKYFMGVDHLKAYNPLKFASFFDSLWTSFKVFYLYLLKTIAPTELSSDYSFNQIPIIKNPFLSFEACAGISILGVLVYVAWKKRNNVYGLSAVMFLFVFLPVSNWIVKIGTIMGERLMYAPSLGLVILAATLAQNLKFKAQNNHSKAKILNLSPKLFNFYFLIFTLLAWYGWVIIDRNKDWRTEKVLLTSGYLASPNSVVSITNMGILAFGDNNYRKAGKWAEEALVIEPNHVPALFLAGHAYKNLGHQSLAESYWLKLVEISPNYVAGYLSLGILYYEQGKLDKAELVLKKSFELERTWGKTFPLAIVKINLGKYDEAIKLITDNFGENPVKRELKFALGLAYLKNRNRVQAEFYLSQIKEQNISLEDYFKKVINQKVFKISEY